ncbi:MAG: hypothetical protein PHS14_07670 [Elusimicrobia bacterium]|nr:hypothetical protein [Elusimicrobiota bacterium]
MTERAAKLLCLGLLLWAWAAIERIDRAHAPILAELRAKKETRR